MTWVPPTFVDKEDGGTTQHLDAATLNGMVGAISTALSAGSSTPVIVTAGNLGASRTDAMDASHDLWVTGTLNANHTATVTPVAGGRIRYYLTQDGTGGRTFSINDGTGTVVVPINSAAGSESIVGLSCVNGTVVEVAILGGVGPTGPTGPVGATGATGPTGPAGSSAWRIEISPFLTPITMTDMASLGGPSGGMATGERFGTGTNTAQIGWDVYLEAGTYKLSILTKMGSAYGIITATVDGTTVGTTDLYNGGVTAVNATVSITGIVVGTGGLKRLVLKTPTKNAGAATYYMSLSHIVLERTA